MKGEEEGKGVVKRRPEGDKERLTYTDAI